MSTDFILDEIKKDNVKKNNWVIQNKAKWNEYTRNRYRNLTPEKKIEVINKNLEYKKNLSEEKKIEISLKLKTPEYREKKKMYNRTYNDKVKAKKQASLIS